MLVTDLTTARWFLLYEHPIYVEYDYAKKINLVKIKMSLSKTIKDNPHYIQTKQVCSTCQTIGVTMLSLAHNSENVRNVSTESQII